MKGGEREDVGRRERKKKLDKDNMKRQHTVMTNNEDMLVEKSIRGVSLEERHRQDSLMATQLEEMDMYMKLQQLL